MYSPNIYNRLIPSLYHASQASKVPMTRLVNAFVFEGLATGYYGLKATNTLPGINETLPWLPKPAMQVIEESPPSNGNPKIHPVTSTEIQQLYEWYDSLQLTAEQYDAAR